MPRHSHTPSAGFVCVRCRARVEPTGFGSKHRNHCPLCLWSLHVDDTPGDRASTCKGPMEPLAIAVREGGEWALVHRCTRCATVKINRVAGDDAERSLLGLALRPIANPAFPLDCFNDRAT